MEDRCGTCPECGGWLVVDDYEHVSCDTCPAEWQSGKRTDLKGRIKERIAASAVKVSTVKAPHTYMKAVGTKELERIIEEVFG